MGSTMDFDGFVMINPLLQAMWRRYDFGNLLFNFWVM